MPAACSPAGARGATAPALFQGAVEYLVTTNFPPTGPPPRAPSASSCFLAARRANAVHPKMNRPQPPVPTTPPHPRLPNSHPHLPVSRCVWATRQVRWRTPPKRRRTPSSRSCAPRRTRSREQTSTSPPTRSPLSQAYQKQMENGRAFGIARREPRRKTGVSTSRRQDSLTSSSAKEEFAMPRRKVSCRSFPKNGKALKTHEKSLE